MAGLLHAMAFMVLLLVGWVIWNNKPLPFCRQCSGHEWTASPKLHDTATVNPALVQYVFNTCCGLLNYINFDEIFNIFEAAKARILCLSSWIITSKTLQFFSAKLVLVRGDGSSKKFRQLSGLCSRTLKLLLCFLFTFWSTRFNIYSYLVDFCCTYSYFVVKIAICTA